jgi:hypothetical protein
MFAVRFSVSANHLIGPEKGELLELGKNAAKKLGEILMLY